jgi:sec-independent protein translocase protein TatA
MMGGFTGIWQWVLIALLVVLLFARPGKISGLMGDFGKGLSNFKKGMKDGNEEKKDKDDELEDGSNKKKS